VERRVIASLTEDEGHLSVSLFVADLFVSLLLCLINPINSYAAFFLFSGV
jgi:hypothetical protein